MNRNLDDLRTEAGYWRSKCDLYRAKSYGPRPTTKERLRELERKAEHAEAALKLAEAAERPAAGSGN